MRFTPVLMPFAALAGVLLLHSLVVFTVTKDPARYSRPFVNGLATMELSLLTITLASATAWPTMRMVWNMLSLICRCALGPCWLWMALESSGVRPLGIEPRRAFLATTLPVAAMAIVILTNPLHGLYWPSARFEDGVMIVETSALVVANTVYCHALLIVGSAIFAVGVARHRGRERRRLALFAAGFALLSLGDGLYRTGRTLPYGINPFSFFMTLAIVIVGVSVARYGFPRMDAPITDEALKTRTTLSPRPLLRAGDATAPAAAPESATDHFASVPGLSERQKAIAELVSGGLTYRSIAERVGITERTVKYHMAEILDKCGLETREQLIAWLAYHGAPPRASRVRRASPGRKSPRRKPVAKP